MAKRWTPIQVIAVVEKRERNAGIQGRFGESPKGETHAKTEHKPEISEFVCRLGFHFI